MQDQICFLRYDTAKNQAVFESADVAPEYLPDLIRDDARFGVFPFPADGVVTYKITGPIPRGLTAYQLERAVRAGMQRMRFYIPQIKVFREAKEGEIPIFQIMCRTTADDPNLTRNTIMYAYYASSKFRGIVVVNANGFYYTPHGNRVSMYVIAPEHYKENTTSKGATIDIDTVFGHEFGHSLGVQHDPKNGNVMTAYYSEMVELLTSRDIARFQAKYGKRKLASVFLDRILKSFRIVSDR